MQRSELFIRSIPVGHTLSKWKCETEHYIHLWLFRFSSFLPLPPPSFSLPSPDARRRRHCRLILPFCYISLLLFYPGFIYHSTFIPLHFLVCCCTCCYWKRYFWHLTYSSASIIIIIIIVIDTASRSIVTFYVDCIDRFNLVGFSCV